MKDTKKKSSAKSKPPKLAEKPVAESQDFTTLVLVHPPNLPLRPYLDDIWDVLTGFDGDLGGIGTDITAIEGDITVIQGDVTTIQTDLAGKQDVLISGTSIKTLNGNSLLGAGDLVIAGGGGDMVLADTQTVSGAKTFNDSKLLLRNVADSFSAKFTNTNSADRTYTLKDANGTLAFTTDITGTNSGTNTGDQTSIVGITGSLAEFNTALTGADFATGGGTATGTNTGDNAVNSNYSGLVSNATHSGDATGSTALTVVGINNTLLSGLATGILKNTTSTGVPSIAVAGDFPTLNQNTSGTANIAGGSAGAIPYQSGAGATTVLAATATANKVLMSGSSAAPTWSTPTFPNASATTGKVIKSDGTNWVASTETIAAPGTTGNVLTSDGTNWTSAAPTGGSSTVMYEGGTGTNTTMVDAATVYFGSSGAADNAQATEVFKIRFYSPVAGTIDRIYVYQGGTVAGSNESWSLYLRVNGTTDTLIEALSSTANPRTWSNTSLGVSISAGDYFTIKSVNPSWATNPTVAFFKCIIYLDL